MCSRKSRRARILATINRCKLSQVFLRALRVRVPESASDLVENRACRINRQTAKPYPCPAAVIKAPSTRPTGIEAERRSFSVGPSRCIIAVLQRTTFRECSRAFQFARAVTRATYGVRQLPRVAWYIGHSLVLRELADTVRQSEKSKARRRRVHTDAPVPDRKRIYADMAKLFLRDLANVEAGIYPVPADHDGSLLALVRRSQLFFEDLPNIHRRRKRRAHNEVLNDKLAGNDPAITCRISTISRAAG